MTLEQASYVSQIVVGISVAGSLIFVGLELRHNAAATRAGLYQNFMQQFARNSESITAAPEFADLLVAANSASRQLTRGERLRARTFYQNVLMIGQNQHLQWRAGWFPQFATTALPILRDAMTAGFVLAEWDWISARLDPDFAAYLQQIAPDRAVQD